MAYARHLPGGLRGEVQDRGGEVWGVLGYGARVGLSYDSTGPLREALAAASAAGGGVVQLPAGIVKTTETIVMPEKVVLRGMGRSATTLAFRPSSASQWAFQHGASGTSTANAGWEDLELDIATANADGGFDIRAQCRTLHWYRVRVVGSSAATKTGLQFTGSTSCNCYHVVRECNFTSLLIGVKLSGPANAHLYEQCVFGSLGTAFDFSKTGSDTTAGTDACVIRCEFAVGVTVSVNLADSAARNTFIKCVCDSATASIVMADATPADTTFVGCRLSPAPDATTLANANFISCYLGDTLGEVMDRVKQVRFTPRTATPVAPASSGEAIFYQKGVNLVIAYNDAGTVRYKSLDLTGTGVTWVHATVAP